MSHAVDATGNYVRVGDQLPGEEQLWFVAVAGRDTVWVADNEDLDGDFTACLAWRFGVEVVR